MKLLIENWKKYLTEAEEINENVSEERAKEINEKELYAQYWWRALETIDSYAEEDDDDLAPGKAIAGTIEAEQVRYALSYLKDLLVLNKNPSEEEIKEAIIDGWKEGEGEFNDDYDQDAARGADDGLIENWRKYLTEEEGKEGRRKPWRDRRAARLAAMSQDERDAEDAKRTAGEERYQSSRDPRFSKEGWLEILQDEAIMKKLDPDTPPENIEKYAEELAGPSWEAELKHFNILEKNPITWKHFIMDFKNVGISINNAKVIAQHLQDLAAKEQYWVEKNLELGASETPDAEPVYKHADASVYDNIEF
jgi:hypothetical protein